MSSGNSHEYGSSYFEFQITNDVLYVLANVHSLQANYKQEKCVVVTLSAFSEEVQMKLLSSK